MKKPGSFHIKFEKDYLNTLVNDETSGVHKKNCQYHIALHPMQLNNFGKSLKDELSLKTAKYDDSFKGVMLSFENVQLQSGLGTIGLDNCFIHFDVHADFYLFNPQIGMILNGIVTKTSGDHVGCLLYQTFNVSLPKLECTDSEWLGDRVEVGNEVQFKITFMNLESRLVYIRGQLLAVLNGSQAQHIKFESIEMSPQKNVKTKKRKVEDIEPEEIPKKKKKKDKLIVVNEEEIHKKKDKRKKKKQDDEVSLDDLDIKSLFQNESFDVSNSVGTMANKEDSKKRKRSLSTSQEVMRQKNQS